MIVAGALLLAVAVALGAFGAHGLKSRLDAGALQLWNTAVQYHFWHALGILAAGLAALHLKTSWMTASGWLLFAGTLLFSGSLYAMALGAPRALGAITPMGGIALILGWLAFGVAALRAA